MILFHLYIELIYVSLWGLEISIYANLTNVKCKFGAFYAFFVKWKLNSSHFTQLLNSGLYLSSVTSCRFQKKLCGIPGLCSSLFWAWEMIFTYNFTVSCLICSFRFHCHLTWDGQLVAWAYHTLDMDVLGLLPLSPLFLFFSSFHLELVSFFSFNPTAFFLLLPQPVHFRYLWLSLSFHIHPSSSLPFSGGGVFIIFTPGGLRAVHWPDRWVSHWCATTSGDTNQTAI